MGYENFIKENINKIMKEDFYPNFEIEKETKDKDGFIILEVTADDSKGASDWAKQRLGYRIRSIKSIGRNRYLIYTGNQ